MSRFALGVQLRRRCGEGYKVSLHKRVLYFTVSLLASYSDVNKCHRLCMHLHTGKSAALGAHSARCALLPAAQEIYDRPGLSSIFATQDKLSRSCVPKRKTDWKIAQKKWSYHKKSCCLRRTISWTDYNNGDSGAPLGGTLWFGVNEACNVMTATCRTVCD